MTADGLFRLCNRRRWPAGCCYWRPVGRLARHVSFFADHRSAGAGAPERPLPRADRHALGRPQGWIQLSQWRHVVIYRPLAGARRMGAFLAFDLFIGSWQVRDARRNRVPFVLVVPCLVLTFLFGPIGLLLYLLLAGVASRGKAWPGHPAVVA